MMNSLYQSFFLLLVSLFSLGLASFTDIRSRIIPNQIPLFMLGVGLVDGVFSAIINQSIFPFTDVIYSIVIAYLIGLSLWYLGIMRGGDVKIITGLGALNPIMMAYLFGAPIIGIIIFFSLIICIVPLAVHKKIPYAPVLFASFILTKVYILQ